MPNRSFSSATTQLVVQVAVAVPDAEGDDRQPWDLQVAEQLQVRVARASGQGPRRNRCSRAWIRSVPTACLSWKTSPARIDSMIPGVPPSSRPTGSSR